MTSAWVFPGQGSQVVGMGHDLYDRSPAARAVFDEANAVLGFDLAGLCFVGPQATLTETENAQPALLTVSAAVLRVLATFGARVSQPRFVAGHSLGEYTALLAAGAIDFATALRLVRRRGALMAAARDGTMAAVIGLDLASLHAACEVAAELGPVVVANENAPGQLVISGAPSAVVRAGEAAKSMGAKRVMPLQVSAAFHSPLMADAATQLSAAIDAASVQPAHIPVIGNVTAQPLVDPAALRSELVAQVTAPVKWIASVEYMVANGVTTFVEIGAGSVLTGLIKRIAPGTQLINVADMDSLQKLVEMSEATP